MTSVITTTVPRIRDAALDLFDACEAALGPLREAVAFRRRLAGAGAPPAAERAVALIEAAIEKATTDPTQEDSTDDH